MTQIVLSLPGRFRSSPLEFVECRIDRGFRQSCGTVRNEVRSTRLSGGRNSEPRRSVVRPLTSHMKANVSDLERFVPAKLGRFRFGVNNQFRPGAKAFSREEGLRFGEVHTGLVDLDLGLIFFPILP